MGQTNKSNNFIIYNISLRYDKFYFTELGIQKITHNWKNINQITFVKEGPGHGSEDITKECNVNCFDCFFFSVFLMDVMGGKINNKLERIALK